MERIPHFWTDIIKLQAISKNEIWLKVEEEVKSQPEEYMKYFEDWLFTSDVEIGPYSFFEAACREMERETCRQ